MRFLRTNPACRLTVGPFFDATDGVTPETALTVTSEKLTLMVDDSNVPTLVIDAAPTASGGNNDMVHVTGDDAGFYDLELTAAQTNYLGRAVLALTNAAAHCPVFHEFMILPAKIYDSLILGTDNLEADAVQVNGNTEAAVRLDRSCRSITKGTVTTGSTTTAVNTTGIDPASSVTDQFKGMILAFDKDTTTLGLRGQKTDITASTTGGVLTVTALTTAPASGDTFTIS